MVQSDVQTGDIEVQLAQWAGNMYHQLVQSSRDTLNQLGQRGADMYHQLLQQSVKLVCTVCESSRCSLLNHQIINPDEQTGVYSVRKFQVQLV